MAPPTYNLNEKSRIWVPPGSDLRMTYDYGEDRSGASITLQYEEREWAYLPHQYSKLTPGTWTEADTEIDDSDLANGNLVVLLSPSTIDQWENRMVELQLITEHSGRQWVAQDFTVIVAQGA